MYGYEIIQYLDTISKGYYRLKEGTLYPILYRLEDNNWVENYRIIDDSKRSVPRKYYKITIQGKIELENQLNSWKNFDLISHSILD